MTRRRKTRLYIKLIILIICFIIVIQIFAITVSRFESNSNSNADVDIAFYVLNEDYQTLNLTLNDIVPREEPYIYNFTVSNEKDGNVAEVDIEYELTVRTTTNLPLEIELYKTENNNQIMATKETVQDEYGTIFNRFIMSQYTFYYDTPKTDSYTLTVYFPAEYNSENYQDITELIEVNVDAKQIIE